MVSTVHQRQTEKAEMLQTIKYQIKLQQMHWRSASVYFSSNRSAAYRYKKLYSWRIAIDTNAGPMGICRQKPYQQLHSVLTKLTPGKVFFSCKSFWALKAASREQNVRNAQPTTQKTWEIAQKFSRGIYKIQITFMTFSYSVS